jgi:hypothetical protein
VIEMSDTAVALQALPHGTKRHVRVQSWLDGELLAEDIPVFSGREDVDRTARVPERVSLGVPRLYEGETWSPLADPLHPLAAYGQRLRVFLGIELDAGRIEWIQRGEFLVQGTQLDGDEVRVEAVGLLALVDEARLVSPYQPSGTLKSTLRGLVEPAVTVVYDSTLVDRSVPSGVNYDEDRLGAVLELLDAWPARARVTNEGYLLVEAETTPDGSDFAVSDGGSVIRTSGQANRDEAYNVVVARGTQSDGTQVQGVAYVETGPLRYPGPFSPMPKPRYFASPLLTTVAQCKAAAITVRDRMIRENTTPQVVETTPLMYAEQGDVVLATGLDGDNARHWLEALSLPYTPSDGSMRMTLTEAVDL